MAKYDNGSCPVQIYNHRSLQTSPVTMGADAKRKEARRLRFSHLRDTTQDNQPESQTPALEKQDAKTSLTRESSPVESSSGKDEVAATTDDVESAEKPTSKRHRFICFIGKTFRNR